MILERLIAYPESRRVFKLHAAAMALLGFHLGALGLIPVLLRKGFGAGEWETTIATSAIPTMVVLSLAWNEIYRRMRPERFLLLIWLTNHLPLAALALCHRIETVLLLWVLSTVTFGATGIFYADVIRHCYAPAIRNRLFGILNTISLLSIMLSSYVFGWLLDKNMEAFRIYLPVIVLAAGGGVLFLYRIARTPLFGERYYPPTADPLLRSLSRLLHHMVRTFRSDPVFRRCEEAFFLYGLGFMFCNALMPFLVTDKLHLHYADIASSTLVAYNLVLLVLSLAGGLLMDRLGPLRVTTWSFVLVIFYPLGLMLTRGQLSLTAVVIFDGIAMTGVNLAGTMVPLTLARDASNAPTYAAIHNTLIGPRALIGHMAAVALYDWSGVIELPLALAAVLYAAGAVLLIRTERGCRQNGSS